MLGKIEKELHIFKVDDLIFQITTADLDVFVDKDANSLVWGLKIDADSQNNELKEFKNSITFESETLMSTKPNQIQDLNDLAGVEVVWEEAEDEDGEAFAFLYLFEHTPIRNSKVEFFINVENKLCVKINATCDLYWKDDYYENLELKIETSVKFKNILMGRKSEEECWETVSPFFHNADEKFQYCQSENGVSTLTLR